MIEIIDKGKCAGCTACYSACPKNAIFMKEDYLGFKYPEVDLQLCVECGVCEKVCFYREEINTEGPYAVLGARNTNEEEVLTSRSGGVFPALYAQVIKDDGIVYGACLNDAMVVEHKGATDLDSCLSFKGSKYVQSDLGDTYRSILSDLKKGITVLFSGTPCQVAGLKKTTPIKYQRNLYTVDIICHGVPSPGLFRDYLSMVGVKYHSEVSSFIFRDKSINGWHDHKESYILKDGRKIVDNLYTELFYTNCFFRESCYSCPFAKISRVSDITLGDFWGWEKVFPSVNLDDKGYSLVFINSKKGGALMDACGKALELKTVSDIESCLQKNLKRPTPSPQNRNLVTQYYVKRGCEKLIKRYIRKGFRWKVLDKMCSFIRIIKYYGQSIW